MLCRRVTSALHLSLELTQWAPSIYSRALQAYTALTLCSASVTGNIRELFPTLKSCYSTHRGRSVWYLQPACYSGTADTSFALHAWLSQAACSHRILLSPLAGCVLVALPIRFVSAQYIEWSEHT